MFTVSFRLPVPFAAQVAPPLPAHVHVAPLMPAGSVSVTAAPVASLGPALLTTTRYVNPTPGVYVAAPSDFVTLKSACGALVSVSVAELFGGLVSVTPAGAAADA